MQTVPYEKMHAIQSDIIRKQEREINALRESNRILEATAQTLAEALAQALSRQGATLHPKSRFTPAPPSAPFTSNIQG